MAKQKPHHIRRSRKHYTAYWLLLVIGAVLTAFALQSLALWLPQWSWVIGFASNATVWSLVQLSFSVGLLVVAAGLWYLLTRTSAIVFAALGALTILPVLGMFMTLGSYARTNDISLDAASQKQMIRTQYAADGDIEYGRVGAHSLELSVYRNNNITKRSPAIVYVHGGGWSGGSRTENSDFFRWLNSRGYTVFSIDYRYARPDYASWRDAPRDVVCALSWVNANADIQHVDRGRVTVMGDSAGGQLALRAAYGLAKGDVTSSCGGTPTIPDKVVGIVPAIDFIELYDDPIRGSASRTNVSQYLGGSLDTRTEAYRDASIITHAASGLPPTLIINAQNDTLVSSESGERLAQALKASGVTVEQYTLPYAAHSYWINSGGFQNQISRGLISRFLD